MPDNILKGSIVIDAPGLQQTANEVSNSLKKMGESSKVNGAAIYYARDAVMDLGHVARDLPYAANNFAVLAGPIGRISTLFQAIKDQTGSVTGAFGAMKAALMGGGGVVIGLELAVSALTLLGGKLFTASNDTKKANEDFKKLIPTFTEISKGITDVAADLASKSVANVTKLAAALTDLSIPLRQRNEALDEYNKIADKQNKLSKDDLDNIGKINTAIENQIQLFEKRALVAAAEDKIKELFKTVFDTQFKIDTFKTVPDQTKSIKNIRDAGSEYEAFGKHVESATAKQNAFFNSLKGDTGIKDVNTGLSLGQTSILSKIVGNPNDLNKALDGVSAAKQKIKELFLFIQDEVKSGSVFGNVIDDGKENKIPKIKFEKLTREKIDITPPDKEFTAEMIAEMLGLKNNTAINFKENPILKQGIDDFFKQPIDVKPRINIVDIQTGLNFDSFNSFLKAAQFQKLLAELNKKFTEIIVHFKEQVFEAVGQGIGDALSGKGFTSLFQGLFNAVGDVLQQLGKTLIETGIGIETLKTALKSFTGFGAIAAGVGLVALGAVVKSSVSKIHPFAEGGLVYGPTLGLIGEGAGTSGSNPEIVAPLNKLKDIIGNIGGSGSIHLTGGFRVDGNDLVLAISRTNQRQRRKF